MVYVCTCDLIGHCVFGQWFYYSEFAVKLKIDCAGHVIYLLFLVCTDYRSLL